MDTGRRWTPGEIRELVAEWSDMMTLGALVEKGNLTMSLRELQEMPARVFDGIKVYLDQLNRMRRTNDPPKA